MNETKNPDPKTGVKYVVWLPLRGEQYYFFTRGGAHQWLANEKEMGHCVKGAVIQKCY